MNKKYFALSMSMMSILSFASCANREIKIDGDSGKELINTILKSSRDKIKALEKGNFIGVDVSSNISGDINYSLTTYDYENRSETTTSKSNNLKSYIKLQTNQNLSALSKNDIKDSEVYFEYNTTQLSERYEPYIETTTIYQKGSDIIKKNSYGQNEEKEYFNLNTSDIQIYSHFVLEIFKYFSISEILSSYFEDYDNSVIAYILNEFNLFKTEEISSKDFIDNINTKLFDGNLFANAVDGTYECSIKLLDNYNEIMPTNYFDYTKNTDSKMNTTLNAKFDYINWGKSVKETLNRISKELKEENISDEFIVNTEKGVVNNLPEEFNFSFTIKCDEEYIINYAKINFLAVGEMNFMGLTSNTDELHILEKLIYDVDLSIDFSCLFVNEAIETKKLEFIKN